MTGPQRLFMWLAMTPVAFLMNWVIIRPAKYYALTKLRSREWHTRTVGSHQESSTFPQPPASSGTGLEPVVWGTRRPRQLRDHPQWR
jgi:hypothetical protein